MAAKKGTLGKRKKNTSRAKSQQRTRRRDCLFRKAFEYCCECDADISLMIRLKHNGQTFVFNSDSRWPVAQGDIFLQYPKPKTITWQDLAARYTTERTNSSSANDQAKSGTRPSISPKGDQPSISPKGDQT